MALTKVSGDFIDAGSITQAHLHSSHGITTSHIAEGDKLFFTNARVDSRVGSLSTSNLSEGTNLYYTDARARAAISGTGSLSYNSTTGVMSFTMPAQNTSNITEGSNLYYTDARVGSYLTTNSYATQSYVNTQVSNLVDSAPGTLDTLNELAAALGDDANFSTTVTNSIATKLPLAGGTLTGNLTLDDGAGASPNLIFKNSSDETWKIFHGSQGVLNFTEGTDDRFQLLQGGNATFSGTITASGYNDSNWNTAYTYSQVGHLPLAGGTLTGDITINSSGLATSPLIRLNNSESSSYNHAIEAINANLTAGESEIIVFGKETNTKNAGYIGYNWAADASNNNYVTIGQWGENHIFRVYGDVVTSQVSLRGSADVRGTIFYDINDTTYYLNPASGSNLFTLDLNAGTVWDATTQGTGKGALHLDPNSGTDHAGGAITWGASDASNGTNGQAGIYVRSDGSYGTKMYFSTTDSYATGSKTAMNILHNGQVNITRSNLIVNTDVRAPIFYDSNNTGYYINPYGQSKIRNNNAQEALIIEGDYPQLTIRRTSIADASIHFDAGFSKKFNIGPGAGGAEEDEFGFAIYDGPRGTHYGTPFRISADTGYVQVGDKDHPAYPLDILGTAYSSADFRAPIFYDSNDTAYYVNPASTSNLNALNVGGSAVWTSGNDGSGSGLDADTLDGSHASAFWAKSGSWYGDLGSHSYTREIGLSMTGGSEFVVLSKSGQGSVLVDGHYMAYESANGFFGSYNSAYGNLTGIRATAANTLKVMQLDGGNAILEVTQDARAPIFYDSNDTAYYVDPNGTSNIYKIQSGSAQASPRWDTAFYVLQAQHWYGDTSSQEMFIGESGNNINVRGILDLNGGHGALNITNSSILSSATSTWTGNPGANGKIQYHSNRWYIVGDASSNRIVQFRRDGSDVSYIDNSGRLIGAPDAKAPLYYDSDNTAYYGDFANTSTSLQTAGKLWVQGGHSQARVHINYQHSATDSANSGALTAWVSEPGIAYNSAGIGGNIHVNGQYYGRQYNSGYGVYVRFDKGNGNLEHWTTTGTAGNSGGQGTRRWYNDASGNSFSINSARAPVFYDYNNTSYYLDAHSTSNLNAATFAGNVIGQNAYFNQDVGIGFTSGNIGGNLNIRNSAAGQIAAKIELGSSVNSSSTGVFVNTTASYASSGMFLHFQSNHISGDDNVLIAYLDGDIVNKNNSYTQYSDQRLKENIVDATSKLEEIKQIRVRNFNFIGEDLKQIGVVAQELEPIFPSLVKQREVPGHDNPIKTVKYSVMVPILIKAMQEQQTIIDDLKSRLETLENQ